jgi:hypothetical protein
MIVGDMTEIRELKVVEADRKFFGDELPYKRVHYAEAFPGTGRADHDGSPKYITDIDPALPYLFIVVEQHRDIDGIWGIYPFYRLHKTFRISIPFVLSQSGPDNFGNVIHGDAQHQCPGKGANQIKQIKPAGIGQRHGRSPSHVHDAAKKQQQTER